MKEKIILGTAQFGINYGINNKKGKPSYQDVYQILNICTDNGIKFLDTAYTYGDSEERIGKYCKENKIFFNIITKLPECDGIKAEKIINESFSRLNVKNVYGYLFHGIKSFKNDISVYDKLKRLKEAGRIEKLGFSLYNIDELEMLFEKNVDFDIIQLPYNIFDNRFESYFKILKDKNIEIHSRSVFLQGLFFLNTEKLEDKFKKIKEKILYLNKLSLDADISIQELCLSFVMRNLYIDKVVIGVDEKEHLTNILSFENSIGVAEKYYDDLKILKEDDLNIILPYKWGK